MLREVPYSGQSIDGEVFMIEDFPDLNCDVEHLSLIHIYLLYVGRQTNKKLQKLGIRTIGQLAESDEKLLESHFGKIGNVLWLSLIHIF